MPEISERKDFDPGIPAERVPAHVAFIMDGNGRWAQARGLSRLEGHARGVRTVIETAETAFRFGIRTITLYAFSTENRDRPPEVVAALMNLLRTFIGEYLPELVKNEVRLRVIGDLSWLPEDIGEAVGGAVARTDNFGGSTPAAAYADDVRRGNAPAGKPDWATFARYLDTAGIPDPDLLIRTSGEQRLSNFLLLQSAYAELYFCDALWPDFSADDLRRALAVYASRERRFGKTGEQVREERK